MAAPIVELRDVRKSFEHHEVLRGVSIALDKGTTLAVMGGSGAGKTVFLRIADGLIRPDAGEVLLFGTRDRAHARGGDAAACGAARASCSRAPRSSTRSPSSRTSPTRSASTRGSARERSRTASTAFCRSSGLPGTDDLLPAELSGGMRKRVGIARALVMEPEVVFFDEPTAGLDPTNARLVAELIAELRTGVCDTAIVVTHDIEFADLVADRMAILHQGRFADVGSPAEIHRSANPDVRKFLAGELRAS